MPLRSPRCNPTQEDMLCIIKTKTKVIRKKMTKKEREEEGKETGLEGGVGQGKGREGKQVDGR